MFIKVNLPPRVRLLNKLKNEISAALELNRMQMRHKHTHTKQHWNKCRNYLTQSLHTQWIFGYYSYERKSSALTVDSSFCYDNSLPFLNESRWCKIYQQPKRTHTVAKHWNKWFDFGLTKKLLHDEEKNIGTIVWEMFELHLAWVEWKTL